MGLISKTKLSRKNAALVAASLICAGPLSEGVTRVYLSSRHVEGGQALIAERERVLGRTAPGGRATAAERLGRWEDSLELHPFFGYVFKPGISLPSQNPNGWRQSNRWGFQTSHEISLCGDRYCIDNEPDRKKLLVIGIFGGSFAHFAAEFGEYLESVLANAAPGRKSVVINFAMGGQSFPQAANIYSYFRDVIDVPVFLDGLNEVWNPVDNNHAGLPPEYAKGVHYKTLTEGARQPPERKLAIERISELKSKIRLATELSLGWGLRNSSVVYLAWSALTNPWTNEIQRETQKVEQSFWKKGLFFDVPDAQVIALAGRQWASWHRMMATIAREQGVPSIHLLQPNPYVKGSKVLSPAERNLVNGSHDVKTPVIVGYPLLKRSVVELKSRRLIAEDLCDIYKNVHEDIWIDSAHANERGYKLVLDRVASLVRQAISKR